MTEESTKKIPFTPLPLAIQTVSDFLLEEAKSLPAGVKSRCGGNPELTGVEMIGVDCIKYMK